MDHRARTRTAPHGVGRASGRGGRGRRGGRHDRTACRHVATCGSTGITQGALSGGRIVPHHDVTQTTGPSYPQSFGHVFTTRRGNPLSVEALRRPSILRGVDTQGRVQRRERPPPNLASCGTGGRVSLHAVSAALGRSGRPGSLLTLAPHRSGRAGSAASGSSTDGFATRRRVPAGPGSQAMATAIPKACLASSAIRCRDVETGPNLGVLAVFPSTGATCRCPLPSTGSRGLNSPASAVL